MSPDLTILLIITGWSLFLGTCCYWRGVNAELRRDALRRHPANRGQSL